MPGFSRVLPAVLVTGSLAAAATAHTQERPFELLRTADGLVLDYPAAGVWRARSRRVAELRARLRREGRSEQLNRPALSRAAVGGDAAVSGTLRFPTVLLSFADLPVDQIPPAGAYDSVMYTSQPLSGRPYTMRTFYEEMSNGLLTLEGKAYGWFAGDSASTYYLDACGTTRNAVDCSQGRVRMRVLFASALTRMDPTVDFGQYDNDGPDGLPNSGDDDGVVDVVQFVHPLIGGECRGRGFWAHKSSFDAQGSRYRTGETGPGGTPIYVNAFHVVSGVGAASCSDGLVMGIGTASHELGHGLGLPDLYDTLGDGEGIGEWGLMGSAGYRSGTSPGHFEAWSKERLGWVVVWELTGPGSYSLGPVVTADTVFLIRAANPNPRGQYFLLENKQPLGADTANLLTGSSRTGPKQGGLLVWLIDSVKVVESGPFNLVNAGVIEGVWLVQADGLRELGAGVNRGDAGDPFPGTTGNSALSGSTHPFNFVWPDLFAGFGLHRIRQLVPNGPMAFYVASGWVVRANKPEGAVSVDGAWHDRYWDAPDSGTTHTVSVDAIADGGYEWRLEFARWSDGGAQTHDVTLTGADDSLVAQMTAHYGITVDVDGPGSVASLPPVRLASPGTLVPESTALRLIALPDAGKQFVTWRGEVFSRSDTLHWTIARPTHFWADFAPPLALPLSPDPPPATWGVTYRHQLAATGGRGSYVWRVAAGNLPTGMTLSFDGELVGAPRQLGVFNVTVAVTSGPFGSVQSLTFPLTLRVDPPAVDLPASVAQVFSADTLIPRAAQLYLDFLGNQNNYFDLGDVAALVERQRAAAAAAEPSPGGQAAARGRGKEGTR